jgi:glycosyltransferase involved in cell wall biosynthesis
VEELDELTQLTIEEDEPTPELAALVDEEEPALLLSVIIPARNEQDSLPACLESLTAQSEPGFELGRDWELIVIDDRSTDATPEILAEAAKLEGVRAMEAPPLDESAQSGFTGKTNACWTGAQAARGALLLFTDADTIHQPGDLSRARHELEKYNVAMLSYSPLQLTSGLLQRMLMPLVFAELAVTYPPQRVNAPEDRTAAANGQFILVRQQDYFDLGGHRAVGRSVLEDVALARNFKRAKRAIRFRYAPDALSTRMYRTNAAMIEGWTKNLALLFTQPIPMAMIALLVFFLAISLPILALSWPFTIYWQPILVWAVWVRGLWGFFARVSKSNFPIIDRVLALFGIPLFAWLLIRSYIQVRVLKKVQWKGRSYSTKAG